MPNFRIETAALADRGRVRSGNEDAAAVFRSDMPLRVLLVVADGVGGLKEGAFASQSVVRALGQQFDACPGDLVDCVDDAARSANGALFARSGGDETRLSGSTVVVLALQAPGATVLHAGDSRAYRLRDGVLEQLTRDHSWVNEQVEAGLLTPAEAEASTRRNIITRCLGVDASVQLERRELGPLLPGDTYLLCSDGLHGPVSDREIARHLLADDPVASIADALVAAANAAGGPDNISVAVARVSSAAYS